ncbi:MAG: PilZ domain-containing protein [Terriglobales bacterium]
MNYLRRLKEVVAEGAPASAPAKQDGKAVATAVAAEFKERRQSVRIRCSGSVEFRAEGRPDRLWGTLTDISFHGCYVEMHTTFPVGTKVSLILKSFGVQIQAPGVVRVSYPFMGMGIGFAGVEAGQQAQLKQLLDSLSGRVVPTSIPVPEIVTKDILVSVDPRSVLNGVWDYFDKHQWLSREEFLQLAKQRRRP